MSPMITVRSMLKRILVASGKKKVKFPLFITISPGNLPIPILDPKRKITPRKVTTSPRAIIILPKDSNPVTPLPDDYFPKALCAVIR